MEGLKKFFLFCSGSEPSILKRTPTELNRLLGIGACVFFTGVFAFAAASYALYTVFNSVWAAVLLGFIWGLMIFNLDRYIVSTLRKKGKFLKDSLSVVPRLALAVLIAMVIAKPLELKIFESEINAEIAVMQQENKLVREDLVRSRFQSDMHESTERITLLKDEIATKSEIRDQLALEALKEADGTGGSLKRNMGPIYAIKKAEADKMDKEFQQLNSNNTALIADEQARLEELQADMRVELNALESVQQGGLASRLHALSLLCEKSNAIYFASLFIMLLFIAIETAPIIVKLMNERSPYDYVLDKHEFAFAMNHKRITSLLENDTRNELAYEIQTSRHRTDLLIDAENKIMKEALKTELDKVDPRSVKWRGILKRSGLFSME